MAHVDSTTDRMNEAPRPQGVSPTNRTRPDPGAPAASRPAHPLPERRNATLDYDRYLERSTAKFKIFSAEERRKKIRTGVMVGIILVAVFAIVVWAILSEG